MRKELAKKEGERKKFKAVFVRLGKKLNYRGYSEETILLKDIVDSETNEGVADHLWFGYTKSFQQVPLHPGNSIEFEARVKRYTKGYVNRDLKINNKKSDFKLSHPTRVKQL